MDASRTAPARGPWVDLHAHPGRFFLEGLAPDQRPGPVSADPDVDRVQAEALAAGMAAVSYATVADYPVLGVVGPGLLGATRAFHRGEAHAEHVRQVAVVHDVAFRVGLPIMRGAADIDVAHATGSACLLLTCEGADFAEGALERITEAHAAGVRSITIVHYRQNEFGDTQTSPPVHGGLSTAGRELVREMNRLGILVDVAHASYQTTLAVLEESSQPVMLSHTHLNGGRRESPRLVSPEHAAAVAAGGGLVGAWPSGFSSETLDDFVDEIVRLVEVVGADHVGIGTDMDANYKPVMDSYSQFAAIEAGLAARGLTRDDTDQILGGNAVELIRKVCG